MAQQLGHTLGACGALEAWMSLEMLRKGWFVLTINLKSLDPACGELDYIVDDICYIETEHIQSNNFAFGGCKLITGVSLVAIG